LIEFARSFDARFGLPLAGLTFLLVLTSCARPVSEVASATLSAPGDWESALYSDHPLVGAIWKSDAGRFVSVEELAAALDSSRMVLLGEKHDNPDHHRLQQNILAYLLAGNRVSSVAFEMMDSEFDSRIDGLGEMQINSLDQLKAQLEWDDAGWDWSFYGPLIAATLEAGVRIRSANISRTRMSEVYGQPLPAEVAGVLDEQSIERLNVEIDESHCGMLPPSQFPAMVRVQQARDHAMASSLAFPASSDQANVLIAGNYHVRRDLGVPRYLAALRPDLPESEIVSLAILEVSPDSDNPADYLQAYSDASPFDFVWFTPAISDADYCASLAQ